jgi:hypothetical protein
LASNSEKELASLGRKSGLALIGPFQRRNGTFISASRIRVITVNELRELKQAGKLNLAGIQEWVNRGPELKEIANEDR